MIKTAIASAIASVFLVASPLWAESPVVVELFTSQGCSSCPPADAIMRDLANREDVIGLALHVDYWDYIGWKDEYADPYHTTRQRAYAARGGRTMIYTPQMVVNGQQDVVGAKARDLSRLIQDHRDAAPIASVTAKRSGNTVTVTVAPIALPGRALYDVRVIQYSPMRHASIRRGELAGHEMDYANVVETWQVAGQWDGSDAQSFRATVTSDLPAVVLLQEIDHGPIIAAERAK